jgi:hypothetical protein
MLYQVYLHYKYTSYLIHRLCYDSIAVLCWLLVYITISHLALPLPLLYPVLYDNAPLPYHYYSDKRWSSCYDDDLPPSADCMLTYVYCCLFMYSVYLPYIAGTCMLALSKGNHPSSVIGLTQEGSRAVISILYCYQHAVVVVNKPSIEVWLSLIQV